MVSEGRRVFVILLLIASVASVSAQGLGVLRDHLVAVVRLSLEEKMQLLVAGHVDTNVNYDKYMSASYMNTSRQECQEILQRGQALLSAGEGYCGFRSELKATSLAVFRSRAVLCATEHTVLDVSRSRQDSMAPETTEYVQNHRFTLLKEKGEWKLAADDLIDKPIPASPATDPLRGEPETTVPTGSDGPLPFMPDVSDLPQAMSAPDAIFMQTSSLNRTAIINYAYKYWKNYNTAYRYFSGHDCTNFVSQAVRAGGWPYVSGWYRSDDAWWYGWPIASWTWAGAHNWFSFTYNRPRGYIARYFSNMSPGDILQVDWQRDGTIDHSMIVTKKDSLGTIYLTYHSNPTRDRSITDILRQYPTSAYYGWHPYSSYN